MSDPIALDALLRDAHLAGASDVHLSAGAPVRVRVDGSLVGMRGYETPLPGSWIDSAVLGLMSSMQRAAFETDREVDMAHEVAGLGRFRINVFSQLGRLAAAIRFVPETAASLGDLGVPSIARDLALRPRGLVLVTGPTGSGKSTTLTAMVDEINNVVPAHIITIEDPIEYIHHSRIALIHQREIGSDTVSFAEALRRVLRQDPDVILIGELRDPESIAVALSAAETGQLVLATLHTQGAAKTINRILDAFPAHQQSQVRAQLSDSLQGVISQTLLPRAQSSGRVLATEVLVQTPAVSNLIREGQIQQLYSAMQSGSALGMHTLDQSLQQLVRSGEVAHQVARQFAADPRSLDDVKVRPGELDADAWMSNLPSTVTRRGM